MRSWDDPVISRASDDSDLDRGSTALALVLEPDARGEYATEADGRFTLITGPATGSITNKSLELNVNR
ncbi:MAG: hypothetical protein LBC09_05135, partial [Helicobacteraceae bacterium]|nr:hypothetical protein [Helicobacteraceae bacterium]